MGFAPFGKICRPRIAPKSFGKPGIPALDKARRLAQQTGALEQEMQCNGCPARFAIPADQGRGRVAAPGRGDLRIPGSERRAAPRNEEASAGKHAKQDLGSDHACSLMKITCDVNGYPLHTQ